MPKRVERMFYPVRSGMLANQNCLTEAGGLALPGNGIIASRRKAFERPVPWSLSYVDKMMPRCCRVPSHPLLPLKTR